MNEYGIRIKFCLHRVEQSENISGQWEHLAVALKEMDELGCAPIIDGCPSGNIAFKVDNGIIVSRSRRSAIDIGIQDFVKVLNFDFKEWEAQYISADESICPTSDTPLYWSTLMETPHQLGWKENPQVAIHGHFFDTQEAANNLNIPISQRETEFGTPEDLEALLQLLKNYPYPTYKIFIRKGHGFFILANTIRQAIDLVVTMIEKNRKLNPSTQGKQVLEERSQ